LEDLGFQEAAAVGTEGDNPNETEMQGTRTGEGSTAFPGTQRSTGHPTQGPTAAGDCQDKGLAQGSQHPSVLGWPDHEGF